MGEDHGMDGVGIEHDHAVGGRGALQAEVHESNLDHEEQAERPDGLGLAGTDDEHVVAPRQHGVGEDDHPAQHEAHQGEAERRHVGEAELDGDGIGAPQRGEKERERGASGVERAMLRHEGGMVA